MKKDMEEVGEEREGRKSKEKWKKRTKKGMK